MMFEARREAGVRLLLAHVAAASLAVLLQGLLLIRYVGPHAGDGWRGPLVGLVALLSHVALVVRSGSREPREFMLLASALMLSVLVMCLRYLASPPLDYGYWKIIGFGLYAVLPSLLVAASFSGRPQLVKWFLMWLLGLAFLPLLPLVTVVPQLGTGPVRWLLHESGVDLIAISRSLGIGIVIAGTLALASRRSAAALLVVGAIVLATCQVVVGERGPMLATIPALGYAAWRLVWLRPLSENHDHRRLVHVGIVFLVNGAAVSWVLWTRHALGAEEGRLLILANAWDSFVRAPLLGVGVGAFRYEEGIAGFRQYAHCLPLEIAAETGVLGLIAFATYFAVALRRWRSGLTGAQGDPLMVGLLSRCMFIYALTAAAISGDLVTNYMVWVAAALVACTDRCQSVAGDRK